MMSLSCSKRYVSLRVRMKGHITEWKILLGMQKIISGGSLVDKMSSAVDKFGI